MPLLVTLTLTAACAVVVAITWRLQRGAVPPFVLRLHTWLGVLGTALWLIFLLLPSDQALVGVLGLGCWWVVSAVGLLLLSHRAPRRAGRGRRIAARARKDGQRLLYGGHVLVFVSAIWFTWAYVTSSV